MTWIVSSRSCCRCSFSRTLLYLAGGVVLALIILSTRTSDAALWRGEPTLEERLERLVERLENQREEMHVAGMAVAVVTDGEVVLSRGFGLRDIESDLPVTEETVFAIGSTTKAFTSALAAMLVDEGRLNWDDPLRTHLPNFALHEAETAEQLTIRDALSHRTGLGRTDIVWASGEATPEQILAAIATAEPRGKFREHFGYNNPMYLFVGLAMENITGSTWPQFVTERLVDPLGMTASTTSITTAQESLHLAKGYEWDDDRDRFKHKPMRRLDNIAPAGAINSNVKDMAQWVRLMLGRGEIDGKRLISESQLEETWQSHIDVMPQVGYGMGWMVREWRGRRLIEHGGNIDGFSAQVALLPDDGLGFVLLANVSHTPLQQGSIEFVFDSLLGETNGERDYPGASVLQKYLGKYHFDMMNSDLTVLIKDGKLAVDVPGQMVFTLLPPNDEGKWQFELTDQISVSFEADDGGQVTAMKLYQAGMTFEMPREGVEQQITPEVSPEQVADYLGRYEWPLAPGDIEITVKRGRLAADVPGQTVYEMHPPDEDGRWAFRMTDQIAIRFNRDEETGEVVSLTVFQHGAETEHRRIEDAPASELPTVDELVERVMAAHGLSADRSLRRMTARELVRMRHQGVTGESVVAAEHTHAYRYDVDLGTFGAIRTVVNEEGAWTESSFNPREDLTGDLLMQARMQHPLLLYRDWREAFDSVAVVGLEEKDERQVLLVELQKGDHHRTVVVDAASWVIRGESYSVSFPGGVSIKRRFTYDDHRSVNGVMLPHRTTMRDELLGRTELETVEIHVDLD